MIWIELIYNLSLLVALSVVSGFVDGRWDRRTRVGQLLQGVVFGSAAMIGMFRPFTLWQGLVFDGRSVVISCAALFFGPLTALATCAMTIPLRVVQGGDGMRMGVTVIAVSAMLGILAHRRRGSSSGAVSALHLLAFGLVVHAAMLAATVALPSGKALGVLETIALPVMVVYPLATVLIGKILSDQSAARYALASLRASEERYRHISENTLDTIWTMDLDLVFTYVNQAVARSGYTAEEWIGSRLADHVPPDRFAEMQALMRREVEKGPGNQGTVFEAEIRRKDGTVFPVEIHAQVVFDQNGRPTGMQGVTRDISERRRHEAGLAHLVRVLRAIRNVNQLITHQREREALLRGVCATLTETRGYGSAWIGLRDDEGRFVAAAQSGLDDSFPAFGEFLRDGALPECCRLALRDGLTATTRDPAAGCRACALGCARRDGAALAARLRHQDRDYGVLVASLPARAADDAEERELFAELAGDIGHALYSIGLEENRARSIRELGESEERFRRSILGAPLPAMIHAEDGEVLLVNRAWTDCTGYAPEEIPTIESWTAKAHGEGQAEALAIVRRLYEGHGSRGTRDFPIRCRDGSVRIWTFHSTALGRDAQGRRFALSMAVDVTEQRRRERENVLASVADRLRAAVVQVGPDGDTTHLRDEIPEILRWGGIAFDAFRLCLADRERDRVACLGDSGWRHSLATEMATGLGIRRQAWESHAPVYCPDLEADDPSDSRDRLAEWCGYPMRSVLALPFPHGVILFASRLPDAFPAPLQTELAGLATTLDGIAVRLADVWSLRESESQLVQARKMEAVGQLAGGVAHDFNNMIMGIMGYADMCREDIAPSHPAREWLDEISAEAGRSALLVRQLLAFARKQTIAPRALDLNQAVAGTIKLLQRLIGEHIDLAWNPCADPWLVNMDPGQIDQILVNLCVNARDAIAEAGKVTIETARATVGADYCAEHPEAAPGNYMTLAVSDDGCGMDRATLERVFEPFFTTKPLGEGTGLGLATVYGIVRQNHGFASVYSEPGRGATFRIYLPRADARISPATDTFDRVPPPRRGDETVLLVEDERSVRVTTTRFLEMAGYTVLAATTPADAIAQMAERRAPVDLLVTDLVMPGMSGRDLAAQLTAKRPEMKCLFISGYTANVVSRHGILEPGVEFLAKPFTREQIVRRVREVLDR